MYYDNKYMEKVANILELNEQDKIWGEIYIIKNTKTDKCYVGQTKSHRKNKNKYRIFGSNGRFADHISEAKNNTKKKQCTYLNNAIRKYGEENFTVECIKKCKVEELDTLETEYIKQYDSIYPNGYNLTKGGKTTEYIKVKNNEELNEFKKRGRDFGYVHKETTKDKMKEYFKTVPKKVMEKKENTMRNTMTEHYNKKRVETLFKKFETNNVILDKEFDKHIRPQKDGDKIINYVIRINRVKYSTITNTQLSPETKYEMLHNSLEQVYKKQQKISQIGKNC